MSDRFEILEEHLKLLRAMHWRWDYCEFGAPAVDSKRPFGSSHGYYEDMARIIGWQYDEDDQDQEDELDRLYRETMTVLMIGIDSGCLAPGHYWVTDKGWQLSGEDA